MRFNIISGDVGHRTSGQSRYTINLATGLRSMGHEVCICGADITGDARSSLVLAGVEVKTMRRFSSRALHQATLMSRASTLGKELALLAMSGEPADWYIVLSDSAVSAGHWLPCGRSVYISNGDLALMFVNRRFYRGMLPIKWLLSRDMSSIIMKNAASADAYTLRLANSRFTKDFMSYIYAIPFQGVVYPPVDTDRFMPAPVSNLDESYAVTMARNVNEPAIPILERVASIVPLRVVGGAEVHGAENLGVLDDLGLSRALSGAAVFVAPTVAEFFGYGVAESLSCGVPVVAFNSCGPAELISHGETGWLAETVDEFLDFVRLACLSGLEAPTRARARKSAEAFSIPASAQRLMGILQAHAMSPSFRLRPNRRQEMGRP